jgi:transposase, IS30 family
MEQLTQAACTRIATKLNRRPRKRLGYRTPEECYVPESTVLHYKVEF